MKKSLLTITLLALMSLTAQASDVEQMEATVSQIMEDAVQASSEAQEGTAVAPDAEKNDTQDEGEKKEPTKDSE
jgi:opacity protein-like surface antigen